MNDDDRPLLLCNDCRKPVYIDEGSDADDPHQCGCDADSWRIATKDEVLDRAGEWA